MVEVRVEALGGRKWWSVCRIEFRHGVTSKALLEALWVDEDLVLFCSIVKNGVFVA